MRVRSGERGQAAAEYLGMLVVVAALLGALATAGLGSQLAGDLRAGICDIAGATCPAPAAPSVAPTPRAVPGTRTEPVYPGTPDERAHTTTPLPPGGDQCSWSPDSVPGLYDFSFACYAHDVCYQNHTLGGVPMTRSACDRMFLGRMKAICIAGHPWTSAERYACVGVAIDYYGAVRAFGGGAYASGPRRGGREPSA